jgi:hypothetical protein
LEIGNWKLEIRSWKLEIVKLRGSECERLRRKKQKLRGSEGENAS